LGCYFFYRCVINFYLLIFAQVIKLLLDCFFLYSIPPRALFKLIGRGESGDITAGYADIIPTDDSYAPLAYGQVLFTGTSLTDTTVEAVAPSTEFRMYVESTGKFPEDLAATPSIALSNSADFPATVKLSLTGFDGKDTGLTGTVTLGPRGHFTGLLSSVPGFENLPSPFYGVLKATTSDIAVTFTGFRLRYNEQPQLLLLATGPLKDISNTNPVIFPHLVDGGGYASQFILIDPVTGAGSRGALRYLSPSGAPLNMAIAP